MNCIRKNKYLLKAISFNSIGKSMASSWSHNTLQIVEFAIIAIFGFGIALYLGSTLMGAIGTQKVAIDNNALNDIVVKTVGANAVNNIINGFSSAISTVLVPVISIIFVLFLYLIVRASGLLGGKKE